MKRKHLFIIGAMKAGTTSLFHYLAQHPDINPSQPKETDFFLKKKKKEEYKNYYSYWQNDRNCKYYMEASPNYTSYPTLGKAADNIKKFVDEEYIEPKFIYLVRNPIDRIKSQKKHQQFCNIQTFNMTSVGIDYWLIEPSKYYFQINEYLKRFNRQDIIVIEVNNLKNSPIEVLESICNFLDINNIQFKTDKVYNKTEEHGRKSGIIFLISKSLLIKRLVNMFFSNEMKGMIKKGLNKILSKKVELDGSLTDEQIEFIKEELEDDLIYFNKEYNIDYTN